MKTTKHFLSMLIALLGLMTLCAAPMRAQQNKNDLTRRTWSDGFMAYKAHRAADGLIVFEGTDVRGEADYRFALEPQGGDFYRLQPAPGRDHLTYVSPAFESAAGRVVGLHSYEGEEYLIFYNEKSSPVYAMAPIRDLLQTMTSDIMSYYLAGEYKTKGGRTIRITPSGTISGLTKGDGEVKFGLVEDDRPSCTISLFDESEYSVIKRDDRINFYKGSYIDGTPFIEAVRTRFLLPEGEDERLGVYPVTARQPLTDGILSQLTTYELQVMRNEIYARHGLRFNRSGRMQAHFEQQPWYQPDTDDVTDRLTELDKLNIMLIRQQEETMNDHP